MFTGSVIAGSDSLDLVSIAGTIASVGRRLREGKDTVYRHLEFDEVGGGRCRITSVRATAEIAALIKKQAVGTFVFWSLPGERRLWCVNADGAKRADLRILHALGSAGGRA